MPLVPTDLPSAPTQQLAVVVYSEATPPRQDPRLASVALGLQQPIPQGACLGEVAKPLLGALRLVQGCLAVHLQELALAPPTSKQSVSSELRQAPL